MDQAKLIEEATSHEDFKFTKDELLLINNTLEPLFDEEIRPAVLLGIAIHAIGLVLHGSDGVLDKDFVVDIVRNSIEV